MDARRFDIVPMKQGWWLGDSQSKGWPFAIESEAIGRARSLARAYSGAVTIYAWRNGQPIELYRFRPELTDAAKRHQPLQVRLAQYASNTSSRGKPKSL
jgi:hypothetical protein